MSRKTLSTKRQVCAVALATATSALVLGPFSSAAGAAVSSLDVATGPTAGGVGVVTITGTGFTSGDRVWFGTVEAKGVQYVSATSIKATPPAHAAATVDVVVGSVQGSGDAGAGDDYTYTDSATITSATYDVVTRLVRIVGTNLGGSAATVAIGGVSAPLKTGSSVTQSATDLYVVPPASLKGGQYDVVVFSPKGTVVLKSGYGVAPKIAKVSPAATPTATIARGTALGGTQLKITGTGFAGLEDVKFGTFDAPFVVVSDTELAVTTPARTGSFPAGKVVETVDIKLDGATSALAASGKKWQYDALPTVTAVDVPSKSASDTSTVGTRITLTGTNLLGVSSVKFGPSATSPYTVTATKQTASEWSAAPTSSTVNTAATEWRVKLPAAKTVSGVRQVPGSVKIFVTTPAGTIEVPGLFSWS